MGKFDGLLLASDFDDTLYSWELRIPERNLEAIRYFIRQGGYFTVSTGRAHRTFAPHVPSVPLRRYCPTEPASTTLRRTNVWSRPVCLTRPQRTWRH